MAFNYREKQINILDTPGHKDFAEDTYRTLTAVDSVIMVIDCANGVEAQTEKLADKYTSEKKKGWTGTPEQDNDLIGRG